MPNPQNIEAHKFVKGQSGNPNGRPRVLPELREVLGEILSEEKTNERGRKFTALEVVLRALHSKAAKGDVRAIQEILDRYYGKVKSTLDVTTNNEGFNIQTIIVNNKEQKKIIDSLLKKE
jgi:hypothetical protein